ncbi:hypothetical protein HNR29_000925 [Rhizobium leguminosarum]|jgi:hypothetical protein|nr:hypothetical protein [Rhizobium leguminosarum]
MNEDVFIGSFAEQKGGGISLPTGVGGLPKLRRKG